MTFMPSGLFPVTPERGPFHFFYASLSPVEYLYSEASQRVPEKIPTTFISSHEKVLTKTDKYYSRHYHGQNKGSSRHLIMDDLMIKGIGPNPLVSRSDEKHSDGILTFQEMLTEFVFGISLAPFGVTPEIVAVGKFVETGHYFLIREHRFPRLAQYDEHSIDKKFFRENKEINIIQKLLFNLLMPFKFGLHHQSINSENINILGQYLDVSSFGLMPIGEQKIFIGPEGNNSLFRIRCLIEEALLIWSAIYNKELDLKDEEKYVAALLKDVFGANNLKQMETFFWHKASPARESSFQEVRLKIDETHSLNKLITKKMATWQHLFTYG